MSIREQWSRLESKMVDEWVRNGWSSRASAALAIRLWAGTFAVFAVLCSYAATLQCLGHEAASVEVCDLMVGVWLFGTGLFAGAMLCEREGRKQ